MIISIIRFIRERFPLFITIPLASIIFFAPLTSIPGIQSITTGVVSIFMIMLMARLFDDLSDFEIDSLTHPERNLVTGKTKILHVKQFLWFGSVLLLAINAVQISSFLCIIGIQGFYLIYFHTKRRLPLYIQPFLINLLFGFIVVYSMLLSYQFSVSGIVLGLFIWISTIAHDFSHSITAKSDLSEKHQSSIPRINPEKSAIVSLLFFVIAFLLGFVYWIYYGKYLSFITILILNFGYIVFLEYHLIKTPDKKHAHPFYIGGFVFFIAPITGLIVEKIIRIIFK